MDKTPKNRLSCKRLKSDNSENLSEVEESPQFLPSTQGIEDIDVRWDWNSPQSKLPNKRKPRIIHQNASPPKKTLKRFPSGNFEKLKAELKALREEISIPDNEACLVLSPVEETAFQEEIKAEQEKSILEDMIREQQNFECDDFFNDDMDETLFQFSQQIETKLEREKKSESSQIQCSLADDSFDLAIQEIPDDIIIMSQIPKVDTNVKNGNKNSTLNRSRSEEQFNVIKPSKPEFTRTQSFEVKSNEVPQYKLEEIERKRKEALAKLQKKKSLSESNNQNTVRTSKEIEEKRLEALAKLEAKKLQESIEKKRLEALKKLELKKKNNNCIKRVTKS